MPALLMGALLLALLLAVLTPALIELWRATDVAPLNVPRDHDNAAARFAASYHERLALALQGPPQVALQQPEAPVRAEQQGLQWCAADSRVGPTARPVVGAGDLLLLPGSSHPHEVYCARDLRLGPGARARAAYAEGHLSLDHGASVSRWVHARDVSLGSGSRVGARVSAVRSIKLEPGARFVRARALTICVARPRDSAPIVVRPLSAPEPRQFAGSPGARFDASSARWLVDGDLQLPPGTDVQADLIVHGDVSLGSACRVRGSLKVHGCLALGDGCVIEGACVVVGPADVGARAQIAGPLVGEDRVCIGADATIGRIDAETSVNGRLVEMEPGATVHGSIWAKVEAGASA